jgi:hypothetical protein
VTTRSFKKASFYNTSAADPPFSIDLCFANRSFGELEDRMAALAAGCLKAETQLPAITGQLSAQVGRREGSRQ